MKIVGREVLASFSALHPDSRKWISNWLADAGASRWSTPQDIKSRYAAASFLADNTVIFNVRGNEYRMVTHVAFASGVVVVEWIGKHSDYDQKY